jgi:hypothetical protein
MKRNSFVWMLMLLGLLGAAWVTQQWTFTARAQTAPNDLQQTIDAYVQTQFALSATPRNGAPLTQTATAALPLTLDAAFNLVLTETAQASASAQMSATPQPTTTQIAQTATRTIPPRAATVNAQSTAIQLTVNAQRTAIVLTRTAQPSPTSTSKSSIVTATPTPLRTRVIIGGPANADAILTAFYEAMPSTLVLDGMTWSRDRHYMFDDIANGTMLYMSYQNQRVLINVGIFNSHENARVYYANEYAALRDLGGTSGGFSRPNAFARDGMFSDAMIFYDHIVVLMSVEGRFSDTNDPILALAIEIEDNIIPMLPE